MTATTAVVATHGDGPNGNAAAVVRKRTRRRKKRPQVDSTPQPVTTDNGDGDDDADTLSISVEYVPAAVPELADPAFRDFQRVFARFGGGGADDAKDSDTAAGDAADAADADGAEGEADADAVEADGDGDSDDEGAKGMSNKAKRLAARLTVAQLKQLVKKPDVVDWVDCTAADPKLLVHLKSYRNTVPVPIHWQQKRKYLQGKRGIEKPPFDLPDFIKQTGIMEIRSAVKEKEDASRLKSKARERIQPKMGKLDLDYQKLHDAFFRWQTKPQLSRHGDMYFEGKEFETKLKMNKPGQLSDDIKTALGMPALTPPPWLINMQRYGPPPSYPGLKIPGLNAPIPEGSHWGFHPGGWGKPPVDEYGRPLYGDVFGVAAPEASKEIMADVERTPWGELEPEEEEEYDGYGEEEFEDNEATEAPSAYAESEAAPPEGLVTPSGLTSVPAGIETPDFIELRKDVRRDDGPKELYKVIPQKDAAVRGFMGSQHTYDLSGVRPTASAVDPGPAAASSSRRSKPAGVMAASDRVDVALNPDDLADGDGGDDAAAEAARRAYDGAVRAARTADGPQEDFSDLVAAHAQRQEAQRKRRRDDGGGADGSGKKKERFKF